MTSPTTPLFKVVKGNPTATEIAALTAVLAQLSTQARRDAAGIGTGRTGVSARGERNLWGRTEDRFSSQLQFNPSAFKNVRFY
ncbi:MAG: acyl-CoA carboxylase subunit epsilon [Corynebacterium sp.]|nr:acyl-CoA carboxylase subunit epsilon [Corynebacterium sp.]